VIKLLKGDDYILEQAGLSSESQQRVSQLFREITDLSGSLHQGTLMSQAAIDIRDGSADYTNLFQQAIQEAAAKIG
jgi:hypothetical protein